VDYFEQVINNYSGLSTVTKPTVAAGNGPVVLAVVESDTGASIAIPFQGNFSTWKAARVEVVAAAADANVTVGYYRVSEDNTPTYAEWDAKR